MQSLPRILKRNFGFFSPTRDPFWERGFFVPVQNTLFWDGGFANEMKQLKEELEKAKHGKNNEDAGHAYSHSTFITTTPLGRKVHEVKTYKTGDGRQITKESRQIGNKSHEFTKVTDQDEKVEVSSSSNLSSLELEDFNKRWEGNIEEVHPSSSSPKGEATNKELQDLYAQVNSLQERIKKLEQS